MVNAALRGEASTGVAIALQIADAISRLLDATELELEDEPTIEEALYIWKDSAADFADCLIGARHRRLGCRATATFDARAVKLPGFVAG